MIGTSLLFHSDIQSSPRHLLQPGFLTSLRTADTYWNSERGTPPNEFGRISDCTQGWRWRKGLVAFQKCNGNLLKRAPGTLYIYYMHYSMCILYIYTLYSYILSTVYVYFYMYTYKYIHIHMYINIHTDLSLSLSRSFYLNIYICSFGI